GTAQLQYNKVKAVQTATKVTEVRDAATKMMEIINERWWAGMWETGLGAMDIAATTTFPGYTALAKGTGALSQALGGDLLWGAISWISGGRIRTNDDVEEQIEEKEAELSKMATPLATMALRKNESTNLTKLYDVATAAMPEFATKLSNVVRSLPNKEFK